jgi:hypothetical protein
VTRFKRWCSDNICRGGEWSSDMVARAILEEWHVERLRDRAACEG